MDRESAVRQLFARRQFTQVERENMKELYANAELLALRIVKTIPPGIEQDFAIKKLKDCLAECETAVALNPKINYGEAECGSGIASSDQCRNEKSISPERFTR